MTSLIRPFRDEDSNAVRNLFININRLIAPSELVEEFEAYILLSLKEEIDRIMDYYAERDGSFWVVDKDGAVAGMFGLESISDVAMELRRMYVSPDFRRQGITKDMLQFAEAEVRHQNKKTMVLSTSELQEAALTLYRTNGYNLEREEIADHGDNKILGSGLRRYYFSKQL